MDTSGRFESEPLRASACTTFLRPFCLNRAGHDLGSLSIFGNRRGHARAEAHARTHSHTNTHAGAHARAHTHTHTCARTVTRAHTRGRGCSDTTHRKALLDPTVLARSSHKSSFESAIPIFTESEREPDADHGGRGARLMMVRERWTDAHCPPRTNLIALLT